MKIKKEIILSLFVILCSLRTEAAGYYKCTDSKGAVSYGLHTCAKGQNQNSIKSEAISHDKEQTRQEQARIVNDRRDSSAAREEEARLEEQFQQSLSQIQGPYERAQLIERRMAQIANKKSGNTSVNSQRNQMEDEQRQIQNQINGQNALIQGQIAAQQVQMQSQMHRQERINAAARIR